MAGSTPLVGKHLVRSLKLMQETVKQLDRFHVPYILDGGTLLGIVRENRLLPWDTDMDLSIHFRNTPELRKAMRRLRFKGYRVVARKFSQDAGPFKKGDLRVVKVRNFLIPFIKGKAVVDIFIRKSEKTVEMWGVGETATVFPRLREDFYSTVKTIDFHGYKYSIPEDAEGFLGDRYGDWRKPVKIWNSMKDDLAIIKNPEIS